MLFCLSLCDETKRVILDQDWHGEVLAVVEGRSWVEAREEAWKESALDPYSYKDGYGWERRAASPPD